MHHRDKQFSRSDELLDELRGRHADDLQEADEEYLVRTIHRARGTRQNLSTGGRGSMPPAMTTNQRRLLLLLIASVAVLLLSLAYSKGAETSRFGLAQNHPLHTAFDSNLIPGPSKPGAGTDGFSKLKNN